MKCFCIIAIAGGILAPALVHAQGAFQNLDFESANVPDIGAGHFGADVAVSDGLPGWTAYIGGNQVTQIWHNNVSLGGAAISIQGPQWNSSQILEGQYTLLLQGLQGNPDQNPGNPVTAAIAQTGQIPSTAQSLRFFGSISSIQVTFNGQGISYAAIGSGPNYTIYGADISGFAGQTGELRLTASSFGGGLLDNLQFSTLAVPEPSPLSLVTLSALFLGWRWRKTLRA